MVANLDSIGSITVQVWGARWDFSISFIVIFLVEKFSKFFKQQVDRLVTLESATCRRYQRILQKLSPSDERGPLRIRTTWL
jgi:hypothetical protein